MLKQTGLGSPPIQMMAEEILIREVVNMEIEMLLHSPVYFTKAAEFQPFNSCTKPQQLELKSLKV